MLRQTPQAASGVERRQFGRRSTLFHAWIVTSNKQRVACRIRNVSTGGALLELAVAAVLPPKFDLLIEDRQLKIRCELRHRSELEVGISFSDIDKGRELYELSALQPQPKKPAEPKPETLSVAPARSRLSPDLIARALRQPQ